jgi:AraC-like DNA-binding protein
MKAITITYGQHHVPTWNWAVLPGRHAGFTFWSVWSGAGTLSLGDVRYELSAGDFFFINYQKEVRGLQDGDNPMLVRYIDFALSDPEIANGWPEHRHLDQSQFMGELFERVRTAQKEEEFVRRQTWLQAVITEYLSVRSAATGNPYSEKIAKLCQTFQQHPERSYDIRLLARDFACTHDHLIRLFKRERGVTPYAYLQNIRLQTAKMLLRNSSNSVKEIAAASGFMSIYDFSRFFRQKTGMPPTAYRR